MNKIEKFIEKRDQILFDEWKECRSAIAKYGEFVHSIRKYGFTVISGLITAEAFLFVRFEGFQPWERLLLSSILCLLILGLFITDMYYLVLIRASVSRAIVIEKSEVWPDKDVKKLTTTIDDKAKQTKIDDFSVLVYILFIVISMIPTFFMGNVIIYFAFTILFISISVIVLMYYKLIRKKEEEEASRREFAVMKLNKEDFRVSLPNGAAPYDMIAEKNQKYYRVQVKHLKIDFKKDKADPKSVDQWEITVYTVPRSGKKTYSREDIDLIFGVDLETDNFAIIPINNIPDSGVVKTSENAKIKDYLGLVAKPRNY